MLTSQIADRRWTQWSLRSLLILVAVLALGFSWWGAKVRKQSRIDRAIRLIAATPNSPRGDVDPMALVRAVNCLHALGKDEAIEVLRKYAAQNPDDGAGEPTSLRFILPLLFDRADPEDQLTFVDWRYFPEFYLVSGDIPFYHHSDHKSGTWPFQTNITDDIELAEKHGRLRSTPLRPVDNPLDQVDSLLDGPLGTSYFAPTRRANKQFLRAQAYRAIATLVPPQHFGTENWPFENDVEWLRLKETCRPLKIRWSEQQQAYVSTNRP